MKPVANPFLRAAHLAFAAITFGALPAFAGTIWDAGGGGTTDINNALNWGGVVNAIDGTTAASFATAGSSATMNVPARFTTLTFNRNDAAGFTIGGASTLSVNITGVSSTQNLLVSNTAANGITTINAPLQVYTTGTTGTRLLNIPNGEADTSTPSLVITGGIAAATTANTFNLRFGGSGSTKVSGAITGISGIQQHFSQTFAGTAIIAGNQALGNVAVLIGGTGAGAVSSTARLELGESTADIQSWGSSTVNQNATLAIKSTATLTGGIDIATVASPAGSSGATIEVAGVLSATTLKIGNSTYTGNLKISGTASFSGALTTGALAGSKIVGNGPTPGTLKLSSGTNLNTGVSTVIGGDGTNENNLKLVKQGAGLLTISGTHSYTGTTTVEGGTLDLSGDIVSATTVQSGGQLNITGTTSGAVSINAGGSIGGEGTLNNTLTFGIGSSSIAFDPATQTGAVTATSIDPSAATMILVTPTAAVTNGTPYVVIKRTTGTFTGTDLAKFALGSRGGTLSLTGGNTEITLTPSAAVPLSLVWKGNISGAWDVASAMNWFNGVGADRFYTGDAVTFEDSASAFAVTLSGTVSPGNIVFNNSSNAYTVSGGSIGGSGLLTKNGSESVTLNGSLANTGGIDVNAGTLTVGNSNTFTGGLNLDGGELRFAGTPAGSLNTQPVTLNGGTIAYTGVSTMTNDTQTFGIASSASGIKTDCPANITWRIGGKISGSGNWVKSGTGILSLGRFSDTSPANDFTGTLTVTGGTLDIRHTDSLGDTASGTTVQDAVLLMQNFGQTAGTFAVDEPLSFSGNAFLTGYCQENKAFTQQFTGDINVASGAIVGISTARTATNITPILELNGTTITTNTGSVLSLGLQPASYPAGSTAAAQTVNIGAAISGPGAVAVQGDAGSVYTLSAPGFSGNTTVNSGTLKLGASNANNETSTVTVAPGAKIDIAFSGNDSVGTLILGGTTVPAGSYNASHPTYGSYFLATGSGSIVVAPASGYSSWQTANGAGSQTVDQDHDNDGVDNGVEYFLGGNTNTTGFTALPAPASGAVTWVKGASYTGTFGTHFKVQSSTNLTTWIDAPSDSNPGVAGTVYLLSGNNVTYTLPTGAGKTFVRLLVNPN
jgi:autotransporter-associated beta strand protein